MSEDRSSPALHDADNHAATAEEQEPLELEQPVLPMRPRAPRPPSPGVMVALMLLVVGIMAVAAFGIWYAWPSDAAYIASSGGERSATGEIVYKDGRPVTPPPMIAPVEYIDISREQARVVNARVPFISGPVSPAAPYYFSGTPQDREKAATCLASAVYYEAGNDPVGMAAVAQVILNRVRHPAFPPTVCGTVFQGSERRTGCQFTYTCDGALARTPRADIWAKARAAADLALSGFVFTQVGTATHYHTDWVVPNWGPELDKLTAVHTHLFFRFKGAWGRPIAFRQPYAGNESIDPRIAMWSQPVPASGAIGMADAAVAVGANGTVVAGPDPKTIPVTTADLGGNAVRLVDPGTGLFIVQLDPAAFPGSYAVLAYKLCKDKARCRVAGWRTAGDMPQRLPLMGNWRGSLSFLYEKGVAGGQSTRWNCQQMPRDNKDQCLDGATAAPVAN